MAGMNSDQVLDLVDRLCKTLSKEKINYCHWKSNAALDRSACGKNDLDLLVDRADSQAFLEILYKLGFKESQSQAEFVMPGAHNYYGYDKSANVIVNVHAHFQLIIGHDLTKNYHIPIEHPYLKSSVQGNLFRVPAPEFELIIFVLRMIIKHFTWDTLLLRQGKLSSSEKNELDYLHKCISESAMYGILAEHFKFIDLNIFQSCLETMLSNYSIWKRLRVGQKMLNCLDPYSRNSQLVDAGLKLWRRLSWPLKRRILRKEARKQMRNGGLMAAIVGGDGAGKTTVVEGVFNWLANDFAVSKFHMGKPKWSFLTILVRGILKIGRVFRIYPFQRTEIQYTNDTDLLVFPGYPWMFREVCTARDRYLTYKKAQQLASNGGLVVLDRFPLPQVKFMDGPQIARMTTGIRPNRLIKSLTHIEEGYYQKMVLPDLLIVLRVDPQIAVQRKTDEDEKNVRSRSTEIWELDLNEISANVVDASHSKEAVLGQVKELLWSRL